MASKAGRVVWSPYIDQVRFCAGPRGPGPPPPPSPPGAWPPHAARSGQSASLVPSHGGLRANASRNISGPFLRSPAPLRPRAPTPAPQEAVPLSSFCSPSVYMPGSAGRARSWRRRMRLLSVPRGLPGPPPSPPRWSSSQAGPGTLLAGGGAHSECVPPEVAVQQVEVLRLAGGECSCPPLPALQGHPKGATISAAWRRGRAPGAPGPGA